MRSGAPIRRLSWRVLVAGGLLAAIAPGQAQETAETAAMPAPIEDLQGHFHLSADDVIDILSGQSLMLTSEEADRLEDARRAALEVASDHQQFAALTEAAEISEPLQIGDLELGAILFLSQSSWSFWLNDQTVTPQALPAGIAVLRVTPRLVELAWTPDPGSPGDVRNVTLAPGQTYLADSARVVETGETLTQTNSADTDGDTASADGNSTGAAEGGSGGAVANAAPGDLALSPEQVDQLGQLQQALSIVSGNAAALGMTEDDLQQLQSSLAASGGTGSLTTEQQEQLNRIQQATGAGQ